MEEKEKRGSVSIGENELVHRVVLCSAGVIRRLETDKDEDDPGTADRRRRHRRLRYRNTRQRITEAKAVKARIERMIKMLGLRFFSEEECVAAVAAIAEGRGGEEEKYSMTEPPKASGNGGGGGEAITVTLLVLERERERKKKWRRGKNKVNAAVSFLLGRSLGFIKLRPEGTKRENSVGYQHVSCT